MNKDLIVGLLVSVALHSTILIFSQKNRPPPRPPVVKEEILQFDMPQPVEDIDETPKEIDDTPVENQLAPPTLTDIPSSVQLSTFQQQLTPPPPPGLTPNRGAINIPVVKPGTNFGAGIKDLFNVGDLDQRPVARVQPGPAYPYEMSRAGISGEVTVEFIINTNGDVTATQIVRSSHREFEVPALQAVQKWKFKPGRKGGRVVNVRASQTLEFNLEDSK